ncbi:nitroreductase family deazaflavin-dependent oxidoreductase [Mycobacteroides abscessus]|uniref:nitroreductase family deazaflavin-dependent oxidoreductase n=1 Tax=Mycobacteroides abscessus TaxID=36809 RepID=UPI00078E3C49|nr:nitroreductase family deazaflavin-dependent oxidoreductase [Mycobacteroides abscessus]AMU68760.1 nitroreductase [Mycobacteroides abscessus]MDM2017692.1 nitroreductase family deazaflavin-dependent oxidoreductase [Mycobacteroides abscessus]MDM2022509.1 nitroreductase family deazaflavin-dependent oxidoreductase [Mycobacteroides abscessus]MDM2026202.1 nitroreductase family deazaflavin-dependent oxidoreductase [Mycobacteroides abscessus]MDM2031887.1 nitroreductase family deazaflavin-dependent ox
MTEGVTSDTYRELSESGVQKHNNRMIRLLRENSGKLPGVPDDEMPVLIVTITGAKSGIQRLTPLGYFEHRGRRFVVGSNGGQERPPSWIFNVRANPEVTVEVVPNVYAAVARELNSEERHRMFQALAAKYAFFGDYQSRITRVIPMFELVPC